MNLRILLPIVGACVCCGCASSVISCFDSDKIIAVDPDGYPVQYARETFDGNICPEENDNFELQMKDFYKRFKQSKRKHIMIYVFGGMNTVDDTVERSSELIRAIWETSDAYPLMINWESSLIESYADHLFFIRSGVRSYTFGPALFPFYFMNDLGRGLLKMPEKTAIQTANIFETEYSVPELDPGILASIEKSPMHWFIGSDYSCLSESQAKRILYGIGLPVRIVTTSLISGFGKSGWDIMIRRARSSFEVHGFEEIRSEGQNYLEAAFNQRKGTVARLMDEVRLLQQEDSSVKITLIGHSMGPFILNEMISRYGDVNFKDIVYMSAASSIRESVVVLRPYLARHPQTTFYNLCVHPRREDEEMLDYAVLPQGSVLQCIDLYFTEQLTIDDYTMGRFWVAMIRFPAQFGRVQNQVVLKAFGIRDPRTNTRFINMPESHTDFSDPNLRFWLPDFWQIPVGTRPEPLKKRLYPDMSIIVDPFKGFLGNLELRSDTAQDSGR